MSDQVTGYRFINRYDVERPPRVGDELDPSYVWDGDEHTDIELSGTCAFETREQVEDYAHYSKGDGWIVVITGNDAGRGVDIVGEILVGDAVVTDVVEW